jgi:hypothetical protein
VEKPVAKPNAKAIVIPKKDRKPIETRLIPKPALKPGPAPALGKGSREICLKVRNSRFVFIENPLMQQTLTCVWIGLVVLCLEQAQF